MSKLPEKELGLLRKFLGMTTSSHDGEALVAIRKANELLSRNRVNWEEFLENVISKAFSQNSRGSNYGFNPSFDMDEDAANLQKQKNARKARERKEIEDAFACVREELEVGTLPRKFVDRMFFQWKERNYLTPRQKTALMKYAKRFKG